MKFGYLKHLRWLGGVGGWVGVYSPDNNATPSAQTTGFDNRSECGNILM